MSDRRDDTDAAPRSDAAGGPHETLARDDAIGPLVERYPELTLSTDHDPFERLVVSIVNQLISTEAARTIRERLFDRFEVTPSAMLAADEAALRDVGLSGQKVEYVRAAATAFQAGRIDPDELRDLGDEAVVDRLTEVRGIGDWTAKMFLLFVLEREDVFPVEDLAVRKGMVDLFGEMEREEMVAFAERWRPYRSYAALYVWQHYVDEESDVDEPVV